MTTQRSGARAWVGVLAVIVLAAVPPFVAAGDVQAGRKGKASDSVVKVQAAAGAIDAQGRQAVNVTFTVDEGWHIYANPAGMENVIETTVAAEAQGRAAAVKVDYPPGRLVKDPVLGDYRVYDGTTTITALVQRTPGDAGPLDVVARFQACCHVANHETCLPAATVRVRVP